MFHSGHLFETINSLSYLVYLFVPAAHPSLTQKPIAILMFSTTITFLITATHPQVHSPPQARSLSKDWNLCGGR